MNLPFKAYWDLLSAAHPPTKRTVYPADRHVVREHWPADSLPRRSCGNLSISALAGDALHPLDHMAFLFIGVALLQQVIAVSVTYLGEM